MTETAELKFQKGNIKCDNSKVLFGADLKVMILVPKKIFFHSNGMLLNWDGLAKHELTEEYKDIQKII